MTDGNTYAIDKYLDEREDWDTLQEAELYIDELEAKLEKALEALDEAVYLLGPDEEDMMKKTGVYRVVTTLAELKGQDDE